MDVLIDMLETILNGRRVTANHFDIQMKLENAARDDYCFTISFDPELYSFDRQNMDREKEFTPYAKPWDKIAK